jgi:flagellar hook-length control protein FliK
LASSAAHISVSTGASVHAPHGRAHQASNKSSQGDNFADMLAATDAAAPEDKARATASSSKEKPAPAEKPETGKAEAADNAAAEPQENQKTPEDGQENVQADTQIANDTAVLDANALTDGLADALIDTNAANDNDAANMIVPQPAQPAPQPVANPALTLAAAQNTTPDEAGADSADAEPAPVAGANLAPAQAAPLDNADSQPAADDGKATGAAQPMSEARTVAAAKAAPGKTAQAEAGNFQNILQDANRQTDAAEPVPATSEASKPVETPPTPAARPSPELNAITLAAPPAQAAQSMAGTDRLAAAAQASTPSLPQAAPDVNQFAVDIAARSLSGAKQFDIRLDPPELGRVDVRLSIDAHGKAEAHLTADQPQTLELLQKDAPALARALRDAGLNVNQDGLNFSLKNQQSHAGSEDNSRGNARAGLGGSNHNKEPRIEEAAATVRRSLGVLDIRV